MALAGGVIALVYALGRGRLGRVLRNIGAVGRRAIQRTDSQDPLEFHRIPYALAILIGATWAAAVKYWPWLSLG